MIILVANLIVAVALALMDLRFVISFEVAFVGALLVFYSSYKAVAKKISDYGAIMGVDSSGDLTKDLSESGESNVDSSANRRKDLGDLGESGESSGDSHKDSVDSIISSVDSPKDSIDSSDLSADSPKNSADSSDSNDNLPKKERFFIGFKVSFGLLRLLSYAFIALSIIALINNHAFVLIPFLLGILTSTLSTAFYAMKKAKSH